jgi:hypothetical protein
MKEYLAGKEFIRLLAEDSSESARDEAFHQSLVRQHPRCFSNGDPGLLLGLVQLGMFNWKTVDLSELASTIDKLEEAEDDLEEAIASTLERCQRLLPLEQDLPIWILPGSSSAEHLKHLNGLSAAYTRESGGIRTVIYPLEGWLEKLPFVLAHEYHHAAMFVVKGDFHQTFIGRVIAEGLADDFASRVLPDISVFWTEPSFPFTKAEELDAYRYLRSRLDRAEDIGTQMAYLSGQLPSDLPLYTGRAIAYRIIQGFVSSQEVSLPDLITLDPKFIVQNSVYQPGMADH